MKAHCIEEADLHDQYSGGNMLSKIRCYKKTYEALLNSADAAALLVEKFSVCGIASYNSFMYGGPVSTSQKSCALGYYTFGHELGHNFGCLHDARQGSNPKHPYGLGKHLEGTGKRTNMAYYAPGHGTKINWYSNPDVMYQGVPTGTENENNARVLREHRFAFATIGDESKACKPDCRATEGTISSGTSQKCVFPFKYGGKYHSKCLPWYGRYWCSLEDEYQSQWGYCDEDIDVCPIKSGCDGGDSCCKNGNCHAGEGDCDRDSDCYGDLVCGKANCHSGEWWGDRSSFQPSDDCCMVKPPGCDGGDSCCKIGECQEGEGDCDSACDCYGHLVCGTDNCITGFPGNRSSFEPGDDCCMKPVCDGGNSCCRFGICSAGEGDCDNDSDCNAGLVCGKHNCKEFPGDRSSFEPTDDCCMVPT